jgi:hypothetical protein
MRGRDFRNTRTTRGLAADLSGDDLIIIPDHDEAGYAHADAIAEEGRHCVLETWQFEQEPCQPKGAWQHRGGLNTRIRKRETEVH